MSQENWVVIGIAIFAFLCGIGIGANIATKNSRETICVERLSHAVTATDTLAIVHDKAYCLEWTQ